MESVHTLPNTEKHLTKSEISEVQKELEAYARQLTAVIRPHAEVLVRTISYLNELQMNYGFCRHASILLCTKWLVYWQQQALAALSQKEALTNEDLILLKDISATISNLSSSEIDPLNDIDVCMPDDLAGENHAELISFLESLIEKIDGSGSITERIKRVFRPSAVRSADNGKSQYASLFLTEIEVGATTIEMFPTLYALNTSGEQVELFSVDHFSRNKPVQQFQRVSKADIERLIAQRAASAVPVGEYHTPVKQESDYYFKLKLPAATLTGKPEDQQELEMFCLLGAGTQYSYQTMRDYADPDDAATRKKATTRMQLTKQVSNLIYKNLEVRDIVATVHRLESELATIQT